MAKLKNIVKELNEVSEVLYFIGDRKLSKGESVKLLNLLMLKKTTVRCSNDTLDRAFEDCESLTGDALGAVFAATAHRLMNGSVKLPL